MKKNPKTFDKTLGEMEDYPYMKTRSGALQLAKMPWQLNEEKKSWISFGLVSTGLGLAFKLIV